MMAKNGGGFFILIIIASFIVIVGDNILFGEGKLEQECEKQMEKINLDVYVISPPPGVLGMPVIYNEPIVRWNDSDQQCSLGNYMEPPHSYLNRRNLQWEWVNL